jgi:hypothetical protein
MLVLIGWGDVGVCWGDAEWAMQSGSGLDYMWLQAQQAAMSDYNRALAHVAPGSALSMMEGR